MEDALEKPKAGDKVRMKSNNGLEDMYDVGDIVELYDVVLAGEIHPATGHPAMCDNYFLDIDGMRSAYAGIVREGFEFPIIED